VNPRHLILPAAAAALAACGAGPTTLQVQPAAATRTTSAQQAAPPSPADPSVPATCDSGPWTGAISPEGRPDNLDAGDAGAVYVWHDGDGWHIRATDRRPTDHHYTGTVALLGSGGFVDVRPVRDERDDRITVAGDVLRYDFHTYASVDGVDFRITCPAGRGRAEERQRLAFHTLFDGRPTPDRVRIGDSRRSPRSADFGFVRST
jgi:hypothetical protein